MMLNTVSSAKELLDIAFRKASKEMLPKIRQNKKKELKLFIVKKISVAANSLDDKITGIIKQFPDIDNSPEFLKEMIATAIPLGEYKRALGHLQSKKKILKMIQRKAIGLIHKSRNPKETTKAERGFFGRVSSVIMELDSDLALLEKLRKEMKEFPDIDAEAPTAIIAGFPNSGKTTMLKRLTGSAPEIAAYPFTTKGLQLGHFEERYLRYQLIDTPGLFDRKMSERNPIEKKAISALKNLAGIIIFVVDASENCGYPLQEQKHLLEEIKKEFAKKTIIVLNKADVASAEQLEKAKKEFGENAVIEGEGIESDLRKKIIKELQSVVFDATEHKI